MQRYLGFWKQAFDFKGDTTRYTYWYIEFSNALIGLGIINLALASLMLSNELSAMRMIMITAMIIVGLFMVLTIVPGLAMSVRRLRNAGLPWALIFLKPFSISDILMLFPAKKNAPRLERKERFYWLGALSMVVSLVGMILFFATQSPWVPIVVMVVGLGLGILDLVFNLKRRRLLALLSLVFAMSTGMMVLGFNAVSNFNRVYEKTETVDGFDRTVFDIVNSEFGMTGKPVSELTVIKNTEYGELDGVKFQIISSKQINDEYVRIAVDIENDSDQPFNLYDVDFELAANEGEERMLRYDSIMADLDLEEYNFRLINDQVVQPGETLKGSLAFEAKVSDAKYLVLSEFGTRHVAFEV